MSDWLFWLIPIVLPPAIAIGLSKIKFHFREPTEEEEIAYIERLKDPHVYSGLGDSA